MSVCKIHRPPPPSAQRVPCLACGEFCLKPLAAGTQAHRQRHKRVFFFTDVQKRCQNPVKAEMQGRRKGIDRAESTDICELDKTFLRFYLL